MTRIKKNKRKTRSQKKAAPDGPWLVEVAYRSSRYDPAGAALSKNLKTNVRVSHLYVLEGALKKEWVRTLAHELLEDPVIQTSAIQPLALDGKAKSKVATADIWFKPGVTDVVGQTVETGLKDFHLDSVRARSGTRYSFPSLKDREVVKKIIERQLINPLIHDYSIH